jgi:hypothetical protein
LDGALQASTSTTIFFYEGTGSYGYTVGAIAGYSVRPASGAIVVRDTLVGQAVLFTRLVVATYPVVFAESGLSAGTTWSVTLGGATLSSTSPSIVIYETNGSYLFSVGPVSGYSVTPGSGTATIGGLPVVLVLAFIAPSSPSTGFLGLPPTTGSYVSGGILGFVGFLVGAMFVQFWKRRPKLPDATEQPTEGQPPSPAETVGRGSTPGNGGSTPPPRAPRM